jgi:hypothetical protein
MKCSAWDRLFAAWFFRHPRGGSANPLFQVLQFALLAFEAMADYTLSA